MKNTVNKLFSMLLACVMALTLVSAAALAEETPGIVASGTCGAEGDGTNLTWTLDGEGLLTISGEGAMADYRDAENQPWKEYGESIQNIVIKNGVSYIGLYAFADNPMSYLDHIVYYPNLTAVEIENGVTQIGRNAFAYSSITSVTIPDSIQTIDAYAFYQCDRLTSAVVPEGITTLPERCFGACGALSSITLPSTLTTIGDSALRGCGLEGITIPSGVTSIGEYAFASSQLKAIVIPEGVTRILGDTFRHCEHLESVTLPHSLQVIAPGMFEFCRALKSITIPEGVRVLASYAFSGCKELTSVILPDSVENIMPGVFNGCGKLETITFPSGLKNLSGTSLLETGWYQAQPEGPVYFGDFLYNYKGEMPENTVFDIPYGTRGIGGKAFANQTNLIEIHIPDSVLYICENAFSYCSGLQSIICPDSVKEIGEYVFNNCSSLTQLYLGNSVERIRQGFIMICGALTELVIPGTAVFDDKADIISCDQLSRVVLLPGIERLTDYFFNHCPSLTEISWPASLTSVGNSAFLYAQNVTDIYYEGTPEQWQQISWGGYNSLPNATVHYNSHIHTPGSIVTENETPAGCVSEGGYDSVVYCAQCSYELSRTHVTVTQTNHANQYGVAATEATATAHGYTAGVYCPDCDTWLSGHEVIHNHLGAQTVVKPATETEEGLVDIVCTVCGQTIRYTASVTEPEPQEEDDVPGFWVRIRDFFRGFIDWFLRLFKRP